MATNDEVMYAVMRCDNLLIPAEKVPEIMAILSDSRPIYKNWNEENFQFVTDFSADGQLVFKPFPIAEVARMELDLAERIENKKK